MPLRYIADLFIHSRVFVGMSLSVGKTDPDELHPYWYVTNKPNTGFYRIEERDVISPLGSNRFMPTQ